MRKILLICCVFIGSIAAGHAKTVKSDASANPLEKAKELQKILKLSDDQTAKVAAIYKDSALKYDKIKTTDNGNTDKMIAEIKPLRVATIQKIKAVLTPAQSVKYDKLVKDSKTAGSNGGWSGGWGSGSSAS